MANLVTDSVMQQMETRFKIALRKLLFQRFSSDSDCISSPLESSVHGPELWPAPVTWSRARPSPWPPGTASRATEGGSTWSRSGRPVLAAAWLWG